MGNSGSIGKNTKIYWAENKAVSGLKRLVTQIGYPNVFDGRPQGIAIWTRDNLANKSLYGREICFDEVFVRDEAIKHGCPANHTDFLYSSIKVAILADNLRSIMFSGSIYYDPLKQQLWARCGSIEANIATLKIALDILLGKDTLESVQKNGTYNKTIENLSDGFGGTDVPFTTNLYSELCEQLAEYRIIQPNYTDIWPSAFSQDCLSPV